MPCPNCGSSTSRELAAGLFECSNVLAFDSPNPIHPALGLARSQRVCGTRYQEATGRTAGFGLCYVCNSLGAVGICGGCRRPVDGVHGTVSSEGLHCPTCAASRAEVRRAEQEQAAASAAAQRAATIRALPTVDYLIEVGRGRIAKCERPATGSEIAKALRALTPDWVDSSLDGRGALSLSMPSGEYIRPDGTVGRARWSGWRPGMRDLNAPDHRYSATDTAEMLRGGIKYIRAISSDNAR